jgi:predicted membrane-bound mannosyltransferase
MPLLLLGTLGIALAFWKADNQFAVFAGLWAIGILTAYSVIPYKTPWLTLNILVPLALTGGYAAEFAWRNRTYARRAAAVTMFAGIVLFAGYQAVVLSFVRYDDERYPYVYAHTSREVLGLVGEVQRLEAQNSDLTIAVTSENQFPLSWYFRGYSAGYYGHAVVTNDSLVIGSEGQGVTLDRLLGERYVRIGSYRLRPGVRLILYARHDVRGIVSTGQVGTGPTGRVGR